MGLGGGPARGWHRQDRLTHSHTVTHKWYASRPPTPTLTPSASSCPNVVLPMPNSKGAERQELEVPGPSVSAMCPAAKLVQDQALLATQPPGQPPDIHDSDTGCLRCAPRPRHGRQNHASTPPSSSCLTLPYPGILQGTYPGEVLPKGVDSSVGSAGSDHRHAAGWVASRGSQGLKTTSSTVNYYKMVALRGWTEMRSLMPSAEQRNRKYGPSRTKVQNPPDIRGVCTFGGALQLPWTVVTSAGPAWLGCCSPSPTDSWSFK